MSGVLALVRNRSIAEALGRNAREAALREFSWDRHVARIWDHIMNSSQAEYPQGGRRRSSTEGMHVDSDSRDGGSV